MLISHTFSYTNTHRDSLSQLILKDLMNSTDNFKPLNAITMIILKFQNEGIHKLLINCMTRVNKN